MSPTSISGGHYFGYEATVQLLNANLAHMADVIKRDLGKDIMNINSNS